MGLISRRQFELRVVAQLSKIRPGAATEARRRFGPAWTTILDHMFRDREKDLSFANFGEIAVECARMIDHTAQNLKDE